MSAPEFDGVIIKGINIMADKALVEQIADAMYKMIKDAAGQKQYKAMDLQKAMRELFPGKADKKICREAIKILITSERCIYTYFGGSYIELPHVEGAANPTKEG